MLFNSYAFIFVFLVPVALGFRILAPAQRVWFLIAASILFYAQWNLGHLAVLLASVAVNLALTRFRDRFSGQTYLWAAVLANLLPLFFFKYSNFAGLTRHDLVLPLAISFFTFQQITFQVQFSQGLIPLPRVETYLFFVLFFPQLVAGPIVRFKALTDQIPKAVGCPVTPAALQNGILLFSLGLFKKVVLADQLAPMADRAFAAAAPACLDAWAGILAFSFQIYFDFGGYADMALGLGLLFGFRLPANFDSPYKATGFIDFWRRWHITLSEFLRDHIYIPLGGNRAGKPRQVLALMTTMLLGGAWHGAGWTFILWGGLHGLFLVLNHLLNQINGPGTRTAGTARFVRVTAVLITFILVTLLWVLFRAETLPLALSYYQALFSFGPVGGVALPEVMLLLACAVLVWGFPNSLALADAAAVQAPRTALAGLAGLLFFLGLKALAAAPARTFVYFNF